MKNLKQRIEDAFVSDEIVGECPAMQTIFRLVKGKIVEGWFAADNLSMMQQS